jgi:hypothetical protein
LAKLRVGCLQAAAEKAMKVKWRNEGNEWRKKAISDHKVRFEDSKMGEEGSGKRARMVSASIAFDQETRDNSQEVHYPHTWRMAPIQGRW